MRAFVLCLWVCWPGLLWAAPPKAAQSAAVAKSKEARPAKDPKGKDAQGKDAQGKDPKGKDAQGKDAKGKDAQGKDAQGKDAKANLVHRKQRRNGKNSKLCDFLSPTHEHEIIPGENLGEIAGRYGVLTADLKRWNRQIKNVNQIRDGQVLNVCPVIVPRERIRDEYTVEKGDTVASIARRYDLTVDEVKAYQKGRLVDVSKLSVGSTLILWRDGDEISAFKPESEKGTLKVSKRLAASRAYHIKRPDRVFGTPGTVSKLEGVFKRYWAKHKGQPVVMGDLSAKNGGPLSGHVSHQDGRDVDLGYVFKKGKGSTTTFVHANAANLDVPRTWALVHELLKTNAVQFIFIDHDIQELLYEEAKKKKVSKDLLAQWFQYPRPAHRLYGIVRHWKGHSDHMHVRFRKN